jgi:hypothetical protein
MIEDVEDCDQLAVILVDLFDSDAQHAATRHVFHKPSPI